MEGNETRWKCGMGKKTGGSFLKSNPMLSGDVDNDVSAGGGVFGVVVKMLCFYCKQRERANKAQSTWFVS